MDERLKRDLEDAKWIREFTAGLPVLTDPDDPDPCWVHPEVPERSAAIADRYEELAKIVDKLPKTADGVSVTPDMELWGIDIDGDIVSWGLCNPIGSGRVTDGDGGETPANRLYSTLAVAQAERKWLNDVFR